MTAPMIFLCQPSFWRGMVLAMSAMSSLAVSLHAASSDPVSFSNDVMAVLSKAGCNAGACHGNANGKGGFKLSLRGQDPRLDYAALTKDQFNRRINLIEPAESLMLVKPLTEIAHEGGKRFDRQSFEYQILQAWISAGAPLDPSDAPKLISLSVTPAERILLDPERQAQLKAIATFSDGSSRDVTRLSVFEAADPNLVEISEDGAVTRAAFGETTILTRYLHEQKPTRLAFVPNRPSFAWQAPAPANLVDEFVQEKLRKLRMNPSPRCDDTAFIRRAYLDLLGIPPTAHEAKAFLQSDDESKRNRLIDSLLERSEFADFWALKWSDLLRVEERALDSQGVEAAHNWVRASIADGKPMDQFARELVSAQGSTYGNPPANYYRALRDPVTRAETTAQLFLGRRLQCAQCHNHPFDRWTQKDYYDWASVFSGIDYKVLQNRRRDSNDKHEFKGEQIVLVSNKPGVKNPATGETAEARFLGATDPMGRQDSLKALGDWLAGSENPYFAKAQVNRVWFHLMGRGIVDPIDDFRPTNPPSHPELLEWLANKFVDTQFDLRAIIRLIMESNAYQASSIPNDTNGGDTINYSHTIPRRLSAEQLLDSHMETAGAHIKFDSRPLGARAAQLPATLDERSLARNPSADEVFLSAFGKPPRLLSCECERSMETSMSQVFQLISGRLVSQLLTREDNRLARLLGSSLSRQAMVEELYWSALSRPPSSEEINQALGVMEKTDNQRLALEDILWALLNSKEFILRY